MNKYEISRINSVTQVLLVMEKYNDRVQTIPIMDSIVVELKTEKETCDELSKKVSSIPLHYGKNKNQAKVALRGSSRKISCILSVRARNNNDVKMLDLLAKSNTELKDKSDAQLFDYCKYLQDVLDVERENLVEYGLSTELENEFKSQKEAFELLISEPRAIVTGRKTNNELLADNIDRCYDILNHKLDNLMELFIDDKEFYLSYKTARAIVDPGYGTRKEQDIPGDEPDINQED